MPLKLAAVLQRSKDHPRQVNEDILDYYDMFTHGNRYVQLYLGEDTDYDFEQRLQYYVKDMGFDDSSIILVDKQWDVEPEEAGNENFAIPDPQAVAPAQPWAEGVQAAWNAAAQDFMAEERLRAGEVIWARN